MEEGKTNSSYCKTIFLLVTYFILATYIPFHLILIFQDPLLFFCCFCFIILLVSFPFFPFLFDRDSSLFREQVLIIV